MLLRVQCTNQNKYFFFRTEIKVLTGWSSLFAIVSIKGACTAILGGKEQTNHDFYKILVCFLKTSSFWMWTKHSTELLLRLENLFPYTPSLIVTSNER